MPDNIPSSLGTICNFALAVIVGLGLKGRLDALSKAVVFKDTCKTCGDSKNREVEAFRDELKLLRASQESNHKEQTKLLMDVYKSLPKRGGD